MATKPTRKKKPAVPVVRREQAPEEKVRDFVSELGDPKLMTRDEWIDFLEVVIDDLQSSLDCAREEKRCEEEQEK